VSTIEQIVEQVRAAAGADFAFLLTRRGRLVTQRAPRDMPEPGRMRLVEVARPLIGSDRVSEVTIPRQELVPYGGAAPIDVYVAVASEQAILAVVLATWAAKAPVAPAIAAGLRALEPILGVRAAAQESKPRPRRDELVVPGAVRPQLRGGTQRDIRVDAALLARESRPSIEPGRSTPATLTPEIAVGEAHLGRESLLAIEQESRPPFTSMPELLRVELDSHPDLGRLTPDPSSPRGTQPWVELPVDSKRAADAAVLGRKLAPPKVSVKLEEASKDLVEAAKTERGERRARPSDPPGKRRR
jgi:hypothetical protein